MAADENQIAVYPPCEPQAARPDKKGMCVRAHANVDWTRGYPCCRMEAWQ